MNKINKVDIINQIEDDESEDRIIDDLIEDESVVAEVKNNPLTEKEKKQGFEEVQMERIETKQYEKL